jgi:L-gulonolactone oxidase
MPPDIDVFCLVVAIGGLISAAPFLVICCCCKPSSRHIAFVVWFLVTVLIGGLWHTLGKNSSRSLWSDAHDGDAKSFTPWTAVWKTSPNTLLLVPEDEEALRDAIVNATRLPLRVVGSGHSWSSTAYTDGTIIDIRRLNAVISLNVDGSSTNKQPKLGLPTTPAATITVQAGMKVQDAAQYLAARGLCLYGVGSIRSQAIGGVVSHGVHGPHPDGLNRHVVGLKVLYANGTFAQITAEDDLYMWRASMGMLGVIVRVTFQVFPLLRLSFQRGPINSFHDLDQIGAHLSLETASTYTGFLYPSKCSQNVGYQRVGSYIGTDPTGELKNQSDFGSRLQLHFNDHMHPAMQYMFSPLGTVVSCLEQLLANAGSSTLLSGPHEDILPNDGLIPKFFEIIDYEYMIPLQHCSTFARELIQEKRFGTLLIPVCLRLLRAEPSCISMAALDSCVFGVESMRGMTHTLDIKAIEMRVAELGGRAHLGKVAATTFRAYDFPCLPRFRTYRYERDPQNRFLTPFLAELIRQQTNSDSTQGEFGPPVNARLKSQQTSQAFGWLAWILIWAAIAGLSLYSHCTYDPDHQHQYMSVPQPHKTYYNTANTQDCVLVFNVRTRQD